MPNKKSIPCFTHSSYANEFWPSLIEKAYAKLNGGYERLEKLNLRECINDLSGLEPELIEFISEDYIN